jgi:hypothetical protein
MMKVILTGILTAAFRGAMILGNRLRRSPQMLKKERDYQLAGFSAPRSSSTARSARAVRKMEVRGDLEQRPEHKAAVFHIVVRNGQALAVNDRIAKQHDVEVERARPPAFGFAHPTLLQLDALSVIEQRIGARVVSSATAALR